MKKKIWQFIAAASLSLILTVSMIFANHPTPESEIMDMINRVETALGEEWQKQTVTKVSNLVYSDNEGNNIIYYVCVTTYYEADATEQTGLNTDAISTVIPPEEAESCRECTVRDLPAAIYQRDRRSYLCWTITPVLSCIIEYDPAVESMEDIFRMAESVPVNMEYENNKK